MKWSCSPLVYRWQFFVLSTPKVRLIESFYIVLLVETIHSDLLRKLLLKIWLSLALHFLLLLDFYLFSLMFLYSLPMMESDSKWIKPKCKNPYLNVKISLFCRFFHSFSILLFYLVDLRKFRRFDGSWLLFRFS